MDEFEDDFDEINESEEMSETDEEWREVVGYPNYTISSYGSIYSRKRGRKLSPTISGKKYKVKLGKPGLGSETKYIDRLVAEAFLENPNPTRWVKLKHLDGDPLNNMVDNLEWANYPRKNLY